MNSNILKSSVTSLQSGISNKSYKKYKRRRSRKKIKNFKRRNQKNLFVMKNNYFNNSGKEKFKKCNYSASYKMPESKNLTSDWYWSNYQKAFEWQGKHLAAHWKACALALQDENKYLLQLIQSTHPQESIKVPYTKQTLSRGMSFQPRCKEYRNSCESHIEREELETEENNGNDDDEDESLEDSYTLEKNENEDFEFEMSEEMIKFFQESFKHKMELKKQKEEKQQQFEIEEKVKEIQCTKVKRFSDMKLLYGEDASKITGMETALELSYNRYCDTKDVKYWPNIPLRL